jgi:hypothetical protein
LATERKSRKPAREKTMTTYTGTATNVDAGVTATSSYTNVAALLATHSNGGNGIYATSSAVAIAASTTTTDAAYAAIYGDNTSTTDSYGNGVYGRTSAINGAGVYGYHTDDGFGVIGSSDFVAIRAHTAGTGAVGLWTTGQPAITANGNVDINGACDIVGTLTKTGGSFRIDHPMYPEERYLNHAFVESSEAKNVYDGIVVADELGRAVIQLPEWFEALNEEFRYQLTPMGEAAPDLHVASEIASGQFEIAGTKPGQRVCWQVTGLRKDPYAKAYPLVVDEPKPAKEVGYYRHPELYGQPEEKGLAWLRLPRKPTVGTP